MDTALHSLVAIARYHRLPSEPDQLAHQFGVPGQEFTDTELLLAAKALTLKAKRLTPALSDLKNARLISWSLPWLPTAYRAALAM